MNISLFIKQLISLFKAAKKSEQSDRPSTSRLPTQSNLTETPSAQDRNSQDLPLQNPTAQDLSAQDLVREIHSQRKFTLAEAIGREGGSFMKGESTIPRPLRAIAQINQFITAHLSNPSGPVSAILQSWAKEDIRVSQNLDTPLAALSLILESLLKEPTTFQEFFRQVVIAQSQLTGDRPHFQPPDQPPHPNAIHSHDSVRQQLETLLQKLRIAKNPV